MKRGDSGGIARFSHHQLHTGNQLPSVERHIMNQVFLLTPHRFAFSKFVWVHD